MESVSKSTTSTTILGLDVHEGWGDGQPRVLDVDLGRRLEYSQPRLIRRLIKRLDEGGRLVGDLCAAVARSGGRPSTEYWLTKKQVYKVIANAETDKADECLNLMIDVFDAWVEGRAKYSCVLLDIPNNFDIVWNRTVCISLAKVEGKVFDGGRFPRYLFPLIGEVYRWGLSDEMYAELKRRNPGPILKHHHHHHFTPEIKDALIVRMPEIVAMAEQAAMYPKPRMVFYHMLGVRGYEHVQMPLMTMQPALSA